MVEHDLDWRGPDCQRAIADRRGHRLDRITAGNHDDRHGHQGQRHTADKRSRAVIGEYPQEHGEAQQAEYDGRHRSEEHTSELQSLMRSSYAVFCLKKKKKTHTQHKNKTKKHEQKTLSKTGEHKIS